MNKMHDAYFGGLIDGEGCITIIRHRAPKVVCGYNHHISVSISMTDKQSIEAASERFGGRPHLYTPKNAKWSSWWSWAVTSKSAYALLVSIRPYLLVKGRQADLAMKFQEELVWGMARNENGTIRRHPESLYEKRQEMYLEIRKMNKRGPEAELEKVANSEKPVTDNAVGNPEPSRILIYADRVPACVETMGHPRKG